MELVIASIGLSIGILNEATYAMVVLIAVFTTVMAAPMLKFCMVRARREPSDDESALTIPDIEERVVI
jgi:Kef-type K+ transport system membrane component KefB